MNAKKLLKKLNLSKEAFDKVAQSVKAAESKSTGEIVLALAAESSDYSFWELFAAVIVSLALTICMLPFAGDILGFYESLNWSAEDWALPAIYGFASFFLILILFVAFNFFLPLDRIVIPRLFKSKAVSDRAMRAFVECGIHSTRDSTGILIFVSYLEKEVRILADKGIAQKIGPDLWRLIANGLAEEIGKKNVQAAFCEAVEKCGELLAQYFPADKDDNPDELGNGVVILEK